MVRRPREQVKKKSHRWCGNFVVYPTGDAVSWCHRLQAGRHRPAAGAAETVGILAPTLQPDGICYGPIGTLVRKLNIAVEVA